MKIRRDERDREVSGTINALDLHATKITTHTASEAGDLNTGHSIRKMRNLILLLEKAGKAGTSGEKYVECTTEKQGPFRARILWTTT